MGKLKFMILKQKHYLIACDALRAYVTFLTDEYHKEPTLKKARAMDDANDTLAQFLARPKSKIRKQVEESK